MERASLFFSPPIACRFEFAVPFFESHATHRSAKDGSIWRRTRYGHSVTSLRCAWLTVTHGTLHCPSLERPSGFSDNSPVKSITCSQWPGFNMLMKYNAWFRRFRDLIPPWEFRSNRFWNLRGLTITVVSSGKRIYWWSFLTQ
jgi:hypothetical protein